MDEKRQTRMTVLARRDAIPSEQRKARSLALCRHLLGVFLPELTAGSTIAVFSALKSEVDLSMFCTEAHLLGFRIAYPCMVKESLGETIDTAASTTTAAATTSEIDFHAAAPATDVTRHAAAASAAAPATDATPMTRGNIAHMQFFLLDPDLPKPDFLAHPARAYSRDSEALEGCSYVAPEEIDAILVPLVAFDSSNNRLGYGGGNYDRLLSQLRPDALVSGIAFSEQRIEHVPLEPHDLPLPHIFVA